MSLLVVEAKHGAFDLRSVRDMPRTPIVSNLAPKPEKITGITDCKSLYDHLSSISSVSKVEDKRVAIDLAILKQCAVHVSHWSVSAMASDGADGS